MANEVQLDGVSLGFVAISVDDDENRARAAEVGPARWPHLQHFHMPADSINALGVSIVPNRLVLDGRTGQVARWWDGTHGKVLKGKHGLSVTNGSHDLLGELIRML
mmetsp:Transcript_13638/g.28790  ORF Transcript_13638/g.28790 Transcript_13638/m.28790 type:complete len:106 (+) Transcript_13638:2143-2460(+)